MIKEIDERIKKLVSDEMEKRLPESFWDRVKKMQEVDIDSMKIPIVDRYSQEAMEAVDNLLRDLGKTTASIDNLSNSIDRLTAQMQFLISMLLRLWPFSKMALPPQPKITSSSTGTTKP